MKKLLMLLASFLVLGTITACGSKGPSGELVIGVPPLNGDFIDGFSSSAYDRYVRDMIWTHGTYTTDEQGRFVLDETVVDKEEIIENDDGTKTYRFTLTDKLKWSDGEAITAKDYVFSVLFRSSPEWKAQEAVNSSYNTLVGWDEYADGTSDSFEGIKLLADNQFEVTIKAEELPYFYETVYASVAPSPMHVWAPGADIGEDGSSIVFSTDGEMKDLKEATEYVATKERYAPSVTAGPFKFESYEQETVTLVNDENYAGDYRGHKPHLEKVIIKRINEKLDVDYVLSGEIDYVGGVIEGEKIQKALDNEDKVGFTVNQRNGYGNISFHTDFAPTNDPLVRQAVAYSIDRSTFINQILGGFGTEVNGMYGLSQWMYTEKKAELDEKLNHYTLNSDEANKLLDQTEWVYEADGTTPFDVSKASKDYLRHNSKGEVLKLVHAGSENNNVSDLIASEFPKNLAKIGMGFEMEYLDFNAMLEYLWTPSTQVAAFGHRKFNSFNLATSFTAIFDPYTSYHSDYFGTPYNNGQVNDPKMDEIIDNLRDRDPEDREGFLEAWLDFQVYYNDFLPEIPIYSNEIYDIYGAHVKNVNTTPVYDIGRAIIDVTVE